MGGTWFHSHGIMGLRINEGVLVPAWRAPRPGVLLCCKQLRNEALDVLYEKTLFFYHMNRPNRELRCDKSFLAGDVQHLEIHVAVYHTRELECAISQLESIFKVAPEKRKHTGVRFRLFAFNNYERMHRNKAWPPEDGEQAWLVLSRLLRMDFGCVPKFLLDRSWQRALGEARVERLKQKADLMGLHLRRS